jgi:hypothetical protein
LRRNLTLVPGFFLLLRALAKTLGPRRVARKVFGRILRPRIDAVLIALGVLVWPLLPAPFAAVTVHRYSPTAEGLRVLSVAPSTAAPSRLQL